MSGKHWTTPEIRRRASEILQKMTLEQKAGQMTQFDWGAVAINPETGQSSRGTVMELIERGVVGSVFNVGGTEETNRLQHLALDNSGLGIPMLIGRDVIHGYRTVFPIPLAQASAWNPELAGQTAAAASKEALADGTNWVFAPMIDVTRDPRWGRIAESMGEDPLLASEYAKMWVEGSQITGKSGTLVASCPKHFAAYGLAEAGRDYNTVDVSDRVLRDTILPPFLAAVESGALSLMASFNEINGIPSCANRYLLTTILRKEWGFQGIVVSDYNALRELVVHGIAADEEEACEISIKAGTDMDMHTGIYLRHLPKLVREGRVAEELVDQAVMRILAVKLKLGLFEQPFVRTEESVKVGAELPEAHVTLARQSARESIVLLQNEKGLLPLDKEASSIAVIGPLADNPTDPIGCWAGDGRPENVVSLLDGIRAAVGKRMDIHYAEGCGIESSDESGFEKALELARNSDIIVLAVGESRDMSGEAHSRTDLDLPGKQRQLVESVASLGKPFVTVLMSGRPLTVEWLPKVSAAIVNAWHLGVQAGPALTDVLFGDYNPSGRLTVTFPRNVGQIPIYYYRKKTGRPPAGGFSSNYLDSPTEPLYAFGYGLSYTSFQYGDIQYSQERIGRDGAFELSVEVTNAGERAGEEVVQCYVRDEAASVTQPLKRLVGFRKVKLAPGESANITFNVASSTLAIWDRDMKFTVEPGEFTFWIGPNSAEGCSVRLRVE